MNTRGTSPNITQVSSSPTSGQLPKFARPPVVEVAISVQFDMLAKFQPVHFGLLYERLRSRYPKTEYHPPLGTVIELFDDKGVSRLSLGADAEFPIGRCWYLSSDDLQLVQIQPDRFIFNWRKLDTDATYPSYSALRQMFATELDVFSTFIGNLELGTLQPIQCELTYVNHLLAGGGWSERHEVNHVLVPWSSAVSDNYLPDVEDLKLGWQYKMQEHGSPLGRLHVQMQSAFRRRDQHPLFVLQLTGRGAPIGGGAAGVLAFTDRAHEWIVRGFTAVTTEEMHKHWGRLI